MIEEKVKNASFDGLKAKEEILTKMCESLQ
jgi:hypothetical protein